MPADKINIISIRTERLHSFLSLLKNNGFSIGIQTHKDCIDLLQLSNKEGHSFKNYLSAIVCKSDEQADLFSSLFDDYFKDDNSTTIDIPKPPIPINYKVILFLLLILISLFIWKSGDGSYGKPIFTPHKLISEPYFNTIKEKDTLYFDSLIKNQSDITDLKINTTLNNNNLTGKVITFSTLGKNELTVKLQSKSTNIDTTLQFKKLYIAHENYLKISSDKDSLLVRAGDEVTYTSPIDTAISCKPRWIINEDTLYGKINGNQSSVTTQFSKTGQNMVTIEYDTSKDSILNLFPKKNGYYSKTYIQNVASDYMINIESSSNKNYTYFVSEKWAQWLGITALCLLLLSLISFLLLVAKQKVKSATNEIRFTGNQKPYELPFRNKEYLIKNKVALAKLSRELKKQIEENHFTLNIPQTIKKTIKNYGLLSYVKSTQKKQSQYIILINEEHTNSQQVKLFRFLVSKMLKEQVIIDFYFYRQIPNRFYTDNSVITYNISQLQDLHYNSKLIIISKGYEFLAYDNPDVKNNYKNEFGFWDNRILATPISQTDWSQNEIYLKRFFSLIPADIEGLLHFTQVLDDQVEITQIGKIDNQYTNKFVDYYDIPALKKYLNNDAVFQWICALACFPRLEWNLTLAIGNLLLTDKNILNYETLLRIVRIEWMHKGTMNSNLRFSLLKELNCDVELRTRAFLVKLLDEYPIDETMFAYEEKRVHQINNNFILYASGYKTDTETKADHDLFLDYYATDNILDFSLLRYLEKSKQDIEKNGKDWNTPIIIDRLPGNDLETYKKNFDKININKGKIWVIIAILCLILSIIPLITLHWLDINKHSFFNTQINKDYALIRGELPPSLLTFEPSECSLNMFNLSKNNKLIVHYEQNEGYREIPLNKKTVITLDPNKKIMYTKANASADYIQYEIVLNKEENYHLTLGGCTTNPDKPIDKEALYIQYFPERIKDSIKLFQKQLSSKKINYNEGLEYRLATSKSEVRYFSEKDKGLAEQLANDASVFFNQEIKAVNPKLADRKPSPIEIWIRKPLRIQFHNTASKVLVQSLNKTKKYTIRTARDLNAGAINTLYYSTKCSMTEVREVALQMIQNGIPLKVVLPIKNLSFDFRIGNYAYPGTSYMNLTSRDISNNVFKKTEKKCTSPSVKVGDTYIFYNKFENSNPSQNGKNLLTALVEDMLQNPEINASIKSYWYHDDKSYDYSMLLTDTQIEVVKKYLIDKGVKENRIISSKSMGDTGYKNQDCFNRCEITLTTKSSINRETQEVKNNSNNQVQNANDSNSTYNQNNNEGYLFYGQFDGKEWLSRYFINLKGDLLYPEEGDEIKAIGDVNIREKEMQLIDNQYINQKSLGVLKVGTTVKVKKVLQIAGGSYIWVAFDLIELQSDENEIRGTRKPTKKTNKK